MYVNLIYFNFFSKISWIKNQIDTISSRQNIDF